MKLCNIMIDGKVHLAAGTVRGVVDLTEAGCGRCMDEVIACGVDTELQALVANEKLPVIDAPEFANVVNETGKLVCVGLNYRAHAAGIEMTLPEQPILFSKFANALVPTNTAVELPPWEDSYDYEAELVVVIGKDAWGVSEEDALDCVFGYTCGNDFSCRDPQKRSGQWLIGKTMPGFGPCGPFIVTTDSYDPTEGKSVRSYVNGQLRQDGTTADMIFSVAKIVSYASHYIKLCPGDLIYTGTPSGVALEKSEEERKWLVPGDKVDVMIEGIGVLSNTLK